MTEERALFKKAMFWLNKVCVLPYTDEELDAIGCLGFDMAKNKDFADKYVACLMEKRNLIRKHQRVTFSDLNLQIYRKVLERPDLENVPDWIGDADQNKLAGNNVKLRIARMSQNILNNKDSFVSEGKSQPERR